MITPTRFGLKFAPTPTLALEYETDVASSLSEATHEAATTTQSLFVYKAKSLSGTSRKRLHVVELPQLTRQSDAATIARELQADDYRFLGPDIVNLSQLRRLLQRLVDHLQQQQQLLPPQTSAEPTNKPRDESDHESEQAMEDSFLDESIAEASTSMQQHHEESADDPPPMVRDPKPAEGSRGRFITAEKDGDEEEEEETRRTTTTRESDDSPSKRDHEESGDHTTVHVQTKADTSLGTAEEQDKEEEQEDADDEQDKEEEQEDADDVELKKDVEAKKAALRADDEDDEELEEEVQSEELEYFSEDASDEDSF
ncbi:hypothetical protein ATCC90586_006884 [Pythium insidiosum]|nr:hypothetical protein ATCC90586_006884 [Pythium insidiosum]